MVGVSPMVARRKLNEHPVSYYAVEHKIKHTVLNNAIRDYLKGKPWGLKAQKVPMTPVYIVEQEDFDAWYARYQQNRQKRKATKMSSVYALDITNVSEDKRGDLSQRIHELMDDPIRGDLGGIKQIGNRQIGLVSGVAGDLTADLLRDKGYDVKLWTGCGHCLQDMPNTGGRCDCECHI